MTIDLSTVASLTLLLELWLPSGLFAQGYPLKEAASKMAMASGLQVQLFAGEPQIRQPIFVKCDDKGRLWTIQYLQYPNPAGLQRVKVDRHSRTVYDRVPEPPPRGPRGADRITICEDTDGDGKADRFCDFVSGLNLCTGLAFGHGGVFVLQVPYLLFYPDRNGDDVPDGEPEVLLSGFGMEDAQSLANHLTWGPDGWLYGVNGSTTTCRIRGIEFQQGVWRYHPLTKEFELFCEGGGNTFGITFDEHGNLFYSTNGGPCIHAIQGAYYYKSFGKHGPLHNPFAYGFLNHVQYDRISLGPPTGGTIYLADQLPALRGRFLAGDFLGHSASWWQLEPAGSTFTAKYQGKFLDSHDSWFGATDLCVVPDGSLFLSDFCDKRTAHPDPDADWDRSNGRIYRISGAGTAAALPQINLARLSSDKLIDLLSHRNHWYRNRARVLLASRNDRQVILRLRGMARQTGDYDQAREGLWTLAAIGRGAWDDALADELLVHPVEDVRVWMVRLLGDRRQVTDRQTARLLQMAVADPSIAVRCQLAATSKRLPAPAALLIAKTLLVRDQDSTDPSIPLLLWWSLEDKALIASDELIQFVTREAHRGNQLIGETRLRLLRRFAADGTARGDAAALNLLRSWQSTDAELQALSRGLAERAVGLPEVGQGGLFANQAADPSLPVVKPREHQPPSVPLRNYLTAKWKERQNDPLRIRLGLQAELLPVRKFLSRQLENSATGERERLQALQLAAEFGDETFVRIGLPLIGEERQESVRLAALNVVAKFPVPEATGKILSLYPKMSAPLQSRSRDILFGRVTTAHEFLSLVEGQPKMSASVPLEQVRLVALLNDEELNARVRKLWGNVQPGTSEEKLAEMRRFNNDLRAGTGDPVHGRTLFLKHCGICHRMNNEGTQIGPDLTIAARGERDALLAHVVDPNSVIRSQYLSFVARTVAGTVHSGLIAEQDAASVTLLDSHNQRTRLPRNQIEEMNESTTSLMPERLLNLLTPQERRDLFSYLQKR